MATAFAEQGGGEAASQNGDEGAQSSAEAVNFEAEARKMGWVPKDEFKGDPEKHIDAEAFFNRSQELMPILKAANKQLRDRLDKAEKMAKQASEFFSQAEERAYKRALEEIRAEQEAAVEAGDLEAHRKASAKLDKLEKPQVGQQGEEADRAAEFADWMTQNRWYANDAFRAFADAEADKIARGKKGFLDRADLDEVASRVKDKFGAAFPDDFGVEKTRDKPRNPVDPGGNAPPRRAGKSVADLPDGGAQMRRFIKAGLVKDEATYLKSYNWSA